MFDWFMDHGIRMLVIIVIGVAIYFILRHFIRLLIKRSVRLIIHETGECLRMSPSLFLCTSLML